MRREAAEEQQLPGAAELGPAAQHPFAKVEVDGVADDLDPLGVAAELLGDAAAGVLGSREHHVGGRHDPADVGRLGPAHRLARGHVDRDQVVHPLEAAPPGERPVLVEGHLDARASGRPCGLTEQAVRVTGVGRDLDPGPAVRLEEARGTERREGRQRRPGRELAPQRAQRELGHRADAAAAEPAGIEQHVGGPVRGRVDGRFDGPVGGHQCAPLRASTAVTVWNRIRMSSRRL